MENKFNKGDMVRVVQSGGGLGPTVYRVSYANWPACQVEEQLADGSFASPQNFDQSLLAHDPGVSADPAPPPVTSDVPVPAPKRKRAPRGSRPPRPPSRPQQWANACAEVRAALEQISEGLSKLEDAGNSLNEVRESYIEWKDNLPENLANSPVAEKLSAIEDLDVESIHTDLQSAYDEAEGKIEEAENMELPMGFGRD